MTEPRTSPMDLLELMWPATVPSLAVAAEHRIADLLADGPKSVAELATASGTHQHSLHRVLQLLAEDQVFAETEPGVFANTPLSELLRPDVPGSQYAMARLVGTKWLWDCWGGLDHSVTTGKAAFDEIHQLNTWAWLGRNPEQGRLFNEAMTSFSEALGPAVAAAYQGFGRAKVVADLGGGQGSYLAAILAAHPSVERGVLADLEPVVEQARARADLAPLVAAGRLDFAPGDFFGGVPAGVDLYTTKQIAHSWDDAKLVELLRRCRKASPTAKIAMTELVHTQDTSRFTKSFDLVMLVTMAGTIRTAADFTRVFTEAGYRVTGVLPTGTAFSVIEAEPVD
ncbi:methyltransferase [Kitasatospora viridis]|uniref:O-methyltransferase n=1 Tax=Kitasatospora viridis TaxID=281105 RepID=A0A561UCF0_9ACTN|nr:methyltransferase [Kitasatospora viridis]TWF97044.1 O-methyltransferase [Kitasatospora viridis]